MTVVLVLVSAFLHAGWNALLRLERDKDRSLVAAVVIATLIAAIVAVIRCGVTGDMPFPTPASAIWSLVAGLFEWVYFASLARALSLGTLGTVYTVSRGGSIVLVWPLSIALFGEAVTGAGAIGSLVVVGGLGLCGLGDGDNRADRPAGLAWAGGCAMSIAAYHLAYKAALSAGGNPSAVFATALTLATAINLVRLGRAGRTIVVELLRTRTARIIVMGTICSGSFLILLEALASGGAGFVLTLRNSSVLFAAILAWAIGDRPGPAQLVGAGLVAAGAVVMATS
jgi:uncharacterized membrane protein